MSDCQCSQGNGPCGGQANGKPGRRPTLRDQFAMAAIQGILADGMTGGNYRQAAKQAYEVADRMLEARDAE